MLDIIELAQNLSPVWGIWALIGYIVLSNRIKLFERIQELHEESFSRSMGYVKDTLNGIVLTSYDRMLECIKDVEETLELEQEKQLYFLILENTFMIHIRIDVRTALLENGFHSFSQDRLQEYIQEKGALFYEKVLIQLKNRSRFLPTLYKDIGHNFSEEEAIKAYGAIISNYLKNESLRDDKVRELKRNSFNFIKKLADIFSK